MLLERGNENNPFPLVGIKFKTVTFIVRHYGIIYIEIIVLSVRTQDLFFYQSELTVIHIKMTSSFF